MNCPHCLNTLEFISGDFNTGVVAPDGYKETQYQEGFYCATCDQYFEESDLEDLIAEGNDTEFMYPI